jgi:DNA ligase-1
MRIHDKLHELGYEGIIVRHMQAPYELKRSLYVMKFKMKREDDYKIVGYKEEYSIDNVAKNTLGALECASGDGNNFFVGTGFSTEDRERLWKERETLIGKSVKIRYQHLTDKKIPRFPVYSEVISND